MKKLKWYMLFNSEASFYCLTKNNINKVLHHVFWYIDGCIDKFFDGARWKEDWYIVLSSLPNLFLMLMMILYTSQKTFFATMFLL